jgi:hypothetical protein
MPVWKVEMNGYINPFMWESKQWPYPLLECKAEREELSAYLLDMLVHLDISIYEKSPTIYNHVRGMLLLKQGRFSSCLAG